MKLKKGQRVHRKSLCPCGSGVKYKSCCYPEDREAAEGGGKRTLSDYWRQFASFGSRWWW